jgi:hypothetical protein
MTQIYIHLSGESSKILLKKRGVIRKSFIGESNALKTRQCPNCFEPNRPDSQFCIKCRIVLSLDSYNDVLKRQKEKELEFNQLKEKQSRDIDELREDMENKFQELINKIDTKRLL